MTKHERGTKSPITLRRVLPIAVVLLLLAAVLIAPAAAEGNVAKVGDAEYSTLQEAITAASTGDTITLLSNIDFGEYSGNTYAMQNSGNAILLIPTGKTLTLKMDEYKISVRETTDGISGYTSLIHIQHGAGLTIDGGTITYDYSAPTADYSGNAVIWTEGTLVTNNAVIKFNASEETQDIMSFGVDLRPNLWGVAAGSEYTASYTMNGGSVDCTAECEAIRVSNNCGDPYKAMPVTLTINGGTVNGYDAIFVQQLDNVFNPLTVNVNGESKLSGKYAIRIYAASETWTYADTTNQVPHCINVEDTVSLTSTYTDTDNSDSVVLLENGITLRCSSAETVDDVKATVTYNGVPMDAVASVAHNSAVSYYPTLQAAITAAEDGATVTLLEDVIITEELSISKAITIDGGERKHTITAGEGCTDHLVEIATSGLAVTLQNLKLDSNNVAKGLNIYNMDETNKPKVTLNNVDVLKSSGSGITIKGSEVTATGLTVQNSGWGQSIDIGPSTSSSPTPLSTLKFDTLDGLMDLTQISDEGKVTSDQVWVNNQVMKPTHEWDGQIANGAKARYAWASVSDYASELGAVAQVESEDKPISLHATAEGAVSAAETNGGTVIYLNYDITFNANEGEGSMEAQTIGRSDDTTTKLTANTFTKDGYVFAGWNTKADGTGISYADESTTKPTEPTTLYAQWIKPVTITFETAGGSTIEPITQVPGTSVPSQKIPTKDGYLFKGWDPVIPEMMPATDLTVTAQWTVKEEANTGNTEATGTPGETEPDVPGELKQETGGKVTFVPDTTADAPIVETEDGITEVTLSSADGVTIKLKSTTGDVTYGAGNSVTGTFDVIETTIIKPATLKGSEKPVSYGLVIPMDVGTDVPQPAITATFNEYIASKVKAHEDRSYNALAMIQASYSGAGGINAVNEKINGKITVTFTIPSIYGQKLVIFHVKDNNPPVLATILSKTIDGNGDTVITAEGDGFSSYVVAQDTTPTNNGGSSTPQGSSVWLTESQTPTPTPEQPSEQPTDVAPTTVPTTQPTATQTETPGFGVLAVLGALGAVAVLRRK